MGRFDGKQILITGGTSGIGLAGARRIIDEGGQIVITGLNERRLAQARRTLGPQTLVVHNDAALPEHADELAALFADRGRLDGIWLNAGFADLGGIDTITADAFDAMMATNVRGPMLQLARLRPLLTHGASVLLTSSTSAYEGAALTPLYAATKGALIAIARSWAAELAPDAIRVNTLVPGAIESNLRSFLPENDRQTFESTVLQQIPLGRVGTCEEGAAVALFLLSDEASFVTGSQYAVDGGLIRH